MGARYLSIIIILFQGSLAFSAPGVPSPSPSPTPINSNKKTVPAKKQEHISTVVRLRDPLQKGNALTIVLNDQNADTKKTLSAQLLFSHTWTNQLATSITIPWILSQKGSGFPESGPQAPRLGGGSFNRLYATSLARLLGNANSYLNLGFSLGFPFQTDQNSINSEDQSWMFSGSISSRYSFNSRFALETSISDTDTFPNHNVKAETYLDSTNTVSWSAQLCFLTSDRVQLRASYSETAPTSIDHGTDNLVNAYINSITYGLRQRTFGAAADIAVTQNTLLFSPEITYLDIGGPLVQGSYTYGMRLKWPF